MSNLKQAHGRPTWFLRATWYPRAPRWWPLIYNILSFHRCSASLTVRIELPLKFFEVELCCDLSATQLELGCASFSVSLKLYETNFVIDDSMSQRPLLAIEFYLFSKTFQPEWTLW